NSDSRLREIFKTYAPYLLNEELPKTEEELIRERKNRIRAAKKFIADRKLINDLSKVTEEDLSDLNNQQLAALNKAMNDKKLKDDEKEEVARGINEELKPVSGKGFRVVPVGEGLRIFSGELKDGVWQLKGESPVVAASNGNEVYLFTQAKENAANNEIKKSTSTQDKALSKLVNKSWLGALLSRPWLKGKFGARFDARSFTFGLAALGAGATGLIVGISHWLLSAVPPVAIVLGVFLIAKATGLKLKTRTALKAEAMQERIARQEIMRQQRKIGKLSSSNANWEDRIIDLAILQDPDRTISAEVRRLTLIHFLFDTGALADTEYFRMVAPRLGFQLDKKAKDQKKDNAKAVKGFFAKNNFGSLIPTKMTADFNPNENTDADRAVFTHPTDFYQGRLQEGLNEQNKTKRDLILAQALLAFTGGRIVVSDRHNPLNTLQEAVLNTNLTDAQRQDALKAISIIANDHPDLALPVLERIMLAKLKKNEEGNDIADAVLDNLRQTAQKKIEAILPILSKTDSKNKKEIRQKQQNAVNAIVNIIANENIDANLKIAAVVQLKKLLAINLGYLSRNQAGQLLLALTSNNDALRKDIANLLLQKPLPYPTAKEAKVSWAEKFCCQEIFKGLLAKVTSLPLEKDEIHDLIAGLLGRGKEDFDKSFQRAKKEAGKDAAEITTVFGSEHLGFFLGKLNPDNKNVADEERIVALQAVSRMVNTADEKTRAEIIDVIIKLLASPNLAINIKVWAYVALLRVQDNRNPQVNTAIIGNIITIILDNNINKDLRGILVKELNKFFKARPDILGENINSLDKKSLQDVLMVQNNEEGNQQLAAGVEYLLACMIKLNTKLADADLANKLIGAIKGLAGEKNLADWQMNFASVCLALLTAVQGANEALVKGKLCPASDCKDERLANKISTFSETSKLGAPEIKKLLGGKDETVANEKQLEKIDEGLSVLLREENPDLTGVIDRLIALLNIKTFKQSFANDNEYRIDAIRLQIVKVLARADATIMTGKLAAISAMLNDQNREVKFWAAVILARFDKSARQPTTEEVNLAIEKVSGSTQEQLGAIDILAKVKPADRTDLIVHHLTELFKGAQDKQVVEHILQVASYAVSPEFNAALGEIGVKGRAADFSGWVDFSPAQRAVLMERLQDKLGAGFMVRWSDIRITKNQEEVTIGIVIYQKQASTNDNYNGSRKKLIVLTQVTEIKSDNNPKGHFVENSFSDKDNIYVVEDLISKASVVDAYRSDTNRPDNDAIDGIYENLLMNADNPAKNREIMLTFETLKQLALASGDSAALAYLDAAIKANIPKVVAPQVIWLAMAGLLRLAEAGNWQAGEIMEALAARLSPKVTSSQTTNGPPQSQEDKLVEQGKLILTKAPEVLLTHLQAIFAGQAIRDVPMVNIISRSSKAARASENAEAQEPEIEQQAPPSSMSRVLTVPYSSKLTGGIPIRLHWSLPLLPLYLVSQFGWLPALVLFPVLSILILGHEFSHIAVMKRFGIETREIILTAVGGMAIAHDKDAFERLARQYPAKEIAIAFAGPLFNLILAGALFAAGMPYSLDYSTPLKVLTGLVGLNMVLAVFNLGLPLFPMDAGRILRSGLVLALKHIFNQRPQRAYENATKAALMFSKIGAGALSLYGLWIHSPTMVIIGVMLILSALNGKAKAQAQAPAGLPWALPTLPGLMRWLGAVMQATGKTSGTVQPSVSDVSRDRVSIASPTAAEIIEFANGIPHTRGPTVFGATGLIPQGQVVVPDKSGTNLAGLASSVAGGTRSEPNQTARNSVKQGSRGAAKGNATERNGKARSAASSNTAKDQGLPVNNTGKVTVSGNGNSGSRGALVAGLSKLYRAVTNGLLLAFSHRKPEQDLTENRSARGPPWKPSRVLAFGRFSRGAVVAVIGAILFTAPNVLAGNGISSVISSVVSIPAIIAVILLITNLSRLTNLIRPQLLSVAGRTAAFDYEGAPTVAQYLRALTHTIWGALIVLTSITSLLTLTQPYTGLSVAGISGAVLLLTWAVESLLQGIDPSTAHVTTVERSLTWLRSIMTFLKSIILSSSTWIAQYLRQPARMATAILGFFLFISLLVMFTPAMAAWIHGNSFMALSAIPSLLGCLQPEIMKPLPTGSTKPTALPCNNPALPASLTAAMGKRTLWQRIRALLPTLVLIILGSQSDILAQSAAQAREPISLLSTQKVTPLVDIIPALKENGLSHKVAAGDSLDKLAKSYHVAVGALRLVNGLKPEDDKKLKVGQELIIPQYACYLHISRVASPVFHSPTLTFVVTNMATGKVIFNETYAVGLGKDTLRDINNSTNMLVSVTNTSTNMVLSVTPKGEFTVTEVLINPVWYSTREPGKVVKPGENNYPYADINRGESGIVANTSLPSIAIHTVRPGWSTSDYVSNGCARVNRALGEIIRALVT
ncbi:MAG: site-2 protease family protein, partial [Candidatus Omnitrophica bacterium]|nr:site-2 protease family protein [Candidatus Omnitrophota bacterium]